MSDARRSNKSRHEWSYRMKQFSGFTEQVKDFFRDDERLGTISRAMARVIYTEAKKKGLGDDIADQIGVAMLPVPYRQWAGILERPWTKPAREAFRKLASLYRKRYEEIRVMLQDSVDLANQTGFGSGGVGGWANGDGEDGNNAGNAGIFLGTGANRQDIEDAKALAIGFKGELKTGPTGELFISEDLMDFLANTDPTTPEPDKPGDSEWRGATPD